PGYEVDAQPADRNAAHDSLGDVAGSGGAITQLPASVVTHGPETAVGSQKQTVVLSAGNRRDIAGHDLLWDMAGSGGSVGAVTQLAKAIGAHGPKAAIGFNKKAVVAPTGNRRHPAGDDLLGDVAVRDRAITQLAAQVVAHGPEAAVGSQKQAVLDPAGNRRN